MSDTSNNAASTTPTADPGVPNNAAPAAPDPKLTLREQISQSMKETRDAGELAPAIPSNVPATESNSEAPKEPTFSEKFQSLPKEIQDAVKKKDVLAIADYLGLDDKTAPDFFKVSEKEWVALRHDNRKAKKNKKETREAITKAKTELETERQSLLKTYGDPHRAKKAWKEGDKYAAFEYMSELFEVPVVEIQKDLYNQMNGKGPKSGLTSQEQAELRALRKEKEERETKKEPPKEVSKSEKSPAEMQKEAMDWVVAGIKSDKLSAMPGVNQLVYDFLMKNYKAGSMDTPMKALAEVKKQLQPFLAGDPAPKRETIMDKSPPRRGADGRFRQGDGRPMSDRELAADVLGSMSREDLWKD